MSAVFDSFCCKKTVRDVDLAGKRVLVRVDYNVPTRKGRVSDPFRVAETIPTLKYILSQKPQSIVLISHRGRPSGEVLPHLSLRPLLPIASKLLGHDIVFLPDCVGKETFDACANPPTGSVFLLENLRFHIEENRRRPDGKRVDLEKRVVDAFCASLSSYGDVYVNDAFAAIHRAQSSSLTGITIPIRVAGLLMEKEIKAMARQLRSPKRPFLAIVGGEKVHTKLPMLLAALAKVDELIVAGGMAYTFLSVAHGMPIGNSVYDEDGAMLVPTIMEKAKRMGVKMHFPVDWSLGKEAKRATPFGEAGLEQGIPADWQGLDIGPRSRIVFAECIWRANTVLLSGPPGAFEIPQYAYGTITTLFHLAAATSLRQATTIVAGGDTAAAALRYEMKDALSFVSTGGNATVLMLTGQPVDTIRRLTDRDDHEHKPPATTPSAL